MHRHVGTHDAAGEGDEDQDERTRIGRTLPVISASTYGPARQAKAINAPK